MSERQKAPVFKFEQHFVKLIIVILALTVLVITAVGIRESRSDSYKLLVLQGSALVEALAQSANNAIVSEQFYDYLVHKRFGEIVADIAQWEFSSLKDQSLVELAMTHNLFGVFVYRTDSTLIAGGFARGAGVRPPDYVYREVCQLIADPEQNYVLLLDEEANPAERVHYYLEISNRLDRVVVIIADAQYYVDALRKTQIGYLAQEIAGEKGIAYIIHQSTDGIIFASRDPGSQLAIESDPFLMAALDSDTVMHRNNVFQGRTVLELVRPFATTEYPYGILRVGLSLGNYNAISRGYDQQMILLSVILFLLVVAALLYLNSRRQRKEITREYHRIKSISDRIFEQMRTGVAAVDHRAEIILANEAFETILGRPKAVGQPWDSIIPDKQLSFEMISSRSGSSLEQELSVNVDGVTKWLLLAVSKMVPDSNEPSGLVAVVYDITNLRELEQKSARRERLSEMGNLAAGVAHEIRNPLNAISIAAQRLASEFTPAENSEEYLSFTRQIRTETARLNEIITRFLALARADQKRRQPINLRGMIGEFVELIRHEANELNIGISFEVADDIVIETDANAFKQVLSNLYNNAKEALSGQQGKIAMRASVTTDTIRLEFTDSGPGISPEIRDKVLTPYYTTKEAGTGLGLPTVYRIIRDMGGDVRIDESSLGGANIIITIPKR